MERRVRLGDVIDDYCTRCRLIMNHGVVGMVGDEVRKVRCNTCQSEHVYKHGRLPARKRRETAKLFADVLRGLGREPDEPGEEAAADRRPDEPDRPEAPDEAGSPGGAPEPEAESAGPVGDETGPPGEPDTPSAPESTHGVRRKLYTIRRITGGKPPTGGGTGR